MRNGPISLVNSFFTTADGPILNQSGVRNVPSRIPTELFMLEPGKKVLGDRALKSAQDRVPFHDRSCRSGIRHPIAHVVTETGSVDGPDGLGISANMTCRSEKPSLNKKKNIAVVFGPEGKSRRTLFPYRVLRHSLHDCPLLRTNQMTD